MLKQLMQHRWIFLVQGGLTLLLGLGLTRLQPLMEDRVFGTFVAAVALLSTGFVLVSAGLLDLAIGVKETARDRKIKPAIWWWILGAVGLTGGLLVLLVPIASMRLLACVAAVQAFGITAFDLFALPRFFARPVRRNLLFGSILSFIAFGVLLVIGAMGSEEMATRAVGFYALYFGVRLMYLGFRPAAVHRTPVAAS